MDPGTHRPLSALVASHLRAGWAWLLMFISLGLGLESLHAWKVGFYLDPGNETRRLMWTLAHAHGVGLGLLNLGFAATARLGCGEGSPRLDLASRFLTWSCPLLPLGFLLAGIKPFDGDPGFPVLLVPLGALGLWLCAALTLLEVLRGRSRPHDE